MKLNTFRNSTSLYLSSLIVFLILSFTSASGQKIQPNPGWPQITKEAKPWSRWWWMGSAVDPTNLKATMEAYSSAGLGRIGNYSDLRRSWLRKSLHQIPFSGMG